MALPLSLGECLEIVDKGLKLYNRIKHEVPDLVADCAERMESVQLYLKRLQTFLNDGNLVVKISPAETEDLKNTLTKMKANISKIVKILEKWQSNQSIGGIAFRFRFVAQAIFALGSSPEELEDLGKKLDKRQDETRDWIQLLILRGQAAVLNGAVSPSQLPAPVIGSNYNILFVDPYNEGRSVAAEGYARLCREWTVRTGGQWRIKFIHSAGFRVKARSNVVQIQQNLGLEMGDGNKPPNSRAMSSLFDTKYFNYPYKDDIRKRLEQRKSRGLTQNIFAMYDFILLFSRHNLGCLENLRDALARRHGQVPPSDKGKLVLLGEYGTSGNKEIRNTNNRGPDGKETIEGWNIVNANIKESFKGFLRKELNWTQPPSGAQQRT